MDNILEISGFNFENEVQKLMVKLTDFSEAKIGQQEIYMQLMSRCDASMVEKKFFIN